MVNYERGWCAGRSLCPLVVNAVRSENCMGKALDRHILVMELALLMPLPLAALLLIVPPIVPLRLVMALPF